MNSTPIKVSPFQNAKTQEQFIIEMYFHFNVLMENQIAHIQSKSQKFIDDISESIERMDFLVQQERDEASATFISLFANASLLVKMVMLLLLIASLVSWTFIIQRWQLFKQAKRAMDSFESTFWSGVELSKLYHQFSAERADRLTGSESIFLAGFKEFMRLRKQTGMQAGAVVEGAQRAMRVAMAREVERLETHLPFLATVGSVSPYIGLFGTVWGIMNAFRGLSVAQQATLAIEDAP